MNAPQATNEKQRERGDAWCFAALTNPEIQYKLEAVQNSEVQKQKWDNFGDDINYDMALGEVGMMILGADGSSGAPRLVFGGADDSNLIYKLETV